VKRLAAICLLFSLCILQGAATAQEKEETVFFNVRSHKYHCLTCGYAQRCTANCIELLISEAKKRGGMPCKICGGTCRR